LDKKEIKEKPDNWADAFRTVGPAHDFLISASCLPSVT
jgi:hypothetical protein